MTDVRAVVFVVDDDESVRGAVTNLLESVNLRAHAFASSEEFFKLGRPNVPCCLVLDVQLPGTSGLHFQESLQRAGITIPIVFITAHVHDLLSAVHQGLEADRVWLQEHADTSALHSRFSELTNREAEVMNFVAAGFANKQIAAELGVSETTVKIHRSRVMQKMQANSLADLVRMSDRLKRKQPA